jgi:regulatory protein YycH of two-component signal transduction system YycFG
MIYFAIKHKSNKFLRIDDINQTISEVKLVHSQFPIFNTYGAAGAYLQQGNDAVLDYQEKGYDINHFRIIRLHDVDLKGKTILQLYYLKKLEYITQEEFDQAMVDNEHRKLYKP